MKLFFLHISFIIEKKKVIISLLILKGTEINSVLRL